MPSRSRLLVCGLLAAVGCGDRVGASDTLAGTDSEASDSSDDDAPETTEAESSTDSTDESSTTETETESSTTETETETGDDSPVDEGCPDDSILYVTDVDGFLAWDEDDLDPLVGVECIEGKLLLSETLPSLTKLASLERIVGDLTIGTGSDCPDPRSCDDPKLLTSLEGLEQLEYVDGILLLEASTSLVTLAGLESLT